MLVPRNNPKLRRPGPSQPAIPVWMCVRVLFAYKLGWIEREGMLVGALCWEKSTIFSIRKQTRDATVENLVEASGRVANRAMKNLYIRLWCTRCCWDASHSIAKCRRCWHLYGYSTNHLPFNVCFRIYQIDNNNVRKCYLYAEVAEAAADSIPFSPFVEVKQSLTKSNRRWLSLRNRHCCCCCCCCCRGFRSFGVLFLFILHHSY